MLAGLHSNDYLFIFGYMYKYASKECLVILSWHVIEAKTIQSPVVSA